MSNPDRASPPDNAAEWSDLRALNTFGLAARARWLRSVSAVEQLPPLRQWLEARQRPHLLLGGGSNIVFAHDFDGTVIHIALKGRRLIGEDRDAWYIEAAAGENWHDFVRWTLAQGWPGLENLSLIPGTVGAAPVQNIGAYGLEIAQRFHRLQAYSLSDGVLRDYDADACRFGYRDSLFKRERSLLITSVTVRLPKRWQAAVDYTELARELHSRHAGDPRPENISDAVIAIRRRKLPDPRRLGNAGSFFKNPLVDAATQQHLLESHPSMPHYPQHDGTFKLAAGWLIEQCGWKGRRCGAVGCYERQALILVNHGNASGEELLRLAQSIQRDVLQRFGVALEPEPLFV